MGWTRKEILAELLRGNFLEGAPLEDRERSRENNIKMGLKY
jgi:hypothetical protein